MVYTKYGYRVQVQPVRRWDSLVRSAGFCIEIPRQAGRLWWVGLFVLQKLSGTSKFCVASYSAFTEKSVYTYFDLKFYIEENVCMYTRMVMSSCNCLIVMWTIASQCNSKYTAIGRTSCNLNLVQRRSSASIWYTTSQMLKCNQHCGEFVKTICGDAMVAVEHGIKTNFTKSSSIENLRLLFL